ncbi:MAG TPA: AraC family transcriptional regulator, partial [Rhizomicrobium sp.]|nr:AraC family transcriptional regulator [Rhizomicrobium sp.]
MPVQTNLQVRDYPALHAMAPHMHDAPSMNIVLGGGFIERIGMAERHYGRGHIAIFPAGMVHSQRFGAAMTRQIIFRPDENWLNYLGDRGTKLADAPHLADIAFCHLGERLLQEICEPDDFSAIASEGILMQILAAFARGNEGARRPRCPPAWLRRVRDLLHAQSCAPLRIAELARAAGRHEVHVAREFRRFYGASIGDYARKLRLESAALRLADPRADLSAVA